MDETATVSGLDSSGGFFRTLVDGVVRYEEARAARSMAYQNSGGGYAQVGDQLVRQRDQQPVTNTVAGKVPAWVWPALGVGAAVVLFAVLKR